ncbi:hypothetical protein LTR70_010167 [Exophiala xenobiotica]|uniref:DUF654-domain-containing protein n=1 Tax=Lithohypha guttulata TaxID=1690604 RepID=A0ABR0JUV2_9EURO|nr:hypothetical protein LTR24_010124 [Lithohypha guttulata]KAK5309577.1 hypothetical protein LTR70_010167 [Exophiala xenobiotica]
MGTRALRKLREQEWEKQLAATRDEEAQQEQESEEEDEAVIVSKPKNAFDMLNEGNEDEDEDDEVEGEESSSQIIPSHPSAPQSSTPKSSKKKKKKAKKKQKDAGTPQQQDSKDVSEDEIDKALKELSLKQRRQGQNETDDDHLSRQNIWERDATKTLAIEPKNLAPVNEMRGLFGNIALEDDSRRNQPTRRREQNLQGGVDLQTALTGRYNRGSQGRELGTLAKRRNCFMQGKEEWPLATSGGLSMEALPVTSWEKQYNIVHNQLYKNAQWDFRLAVESMQAEAIIALLQKYPYHVASLLQVSEIAKHQGDSSLSGDLLERALFTFGRSVNSSFPTAFREGTARLSFDKPSNRELYLTIWRYIRNLEQRGTWKTAFEWAKLLLQFNTTSDPFAVTLMIDQLALRGRQHEQLLSLTDSSAYGNTWSHLPNITISRTLALLRANKPRDARQQLALAIHRYPYILSALASAIEVQPLPKSLWAKLPSTDAEKLYTELYVTRAKDLWNTPETIGLISEVANTMQYYKAHVDSLPDAPDLQISLEEARYVMALEIPALIALLPRQFTNMPTSSSDVLPPPTSEASDLTRRAPTEGAGAAGGPGIVQVGNDLVQRALRWFFNPATDTTNADNDQNNRASPEELQALREELGPEAANLPDEALEQLVQAQMAAEFGELDDEEIRRAFTVGGAMAGGWDYYEEAANAPDDDDSDELPELEDIVDPNSTVGAAIAGEVVDEGEEGPPAQARRPHAATVEEVDDEDEPPQMPAGTYTAMGPLLRLQDEDNTPAFDLPSTNQPTARARRDAPITVTQAPTPSPVVSTPAAPEEDIESSPQRIQRWLITIGLQELKTNPNMSLYVRRLKMLNKNQQTWIINVVKQQGSGDLAAKVQAAI